MREVLAVYNGYYKGRQVPGDLQEMLFHPLHILIPVVFCLDRLTKYLVIERLEYGSRMVFAPFIAIVHVRNQGGAFSLLAGNPYAGYIFTFIPVIVAVILFYILFFHPLTPLKRLSVSLVIAGALGNIYDRFVYGYVVDFIDIFLGRYHWPAFNVADSSVTLGVFLWLFLEVSGPARGGRKKAK